jgi:hypothetical protein
MCIGGALGKQQGNALPFQTSQSALNAASRKTQDEEQQALLEQNKQDQYELRKSANARSGRSSLLSGSAGGRGFTTTAAKKTNKTTLGV